MTPLVLNLGAGQEKLRLNLEVEAGCCAACTKEPIEERLTMEIEYSGVPCTVIICRHCLGEHSPDLLSIIEAPREPKRRLFGKRRP